MNPTTLMVLSQVFGTITTVITIIVLLQKKMSVILTLTILENTMSALSNLCLLPGGISGAVICAFAVIQAIISRSYEKNDKKVPVPITVVFIFIYIAIGAITYKVPADILPALGATFYGLAVVQKKPFAYRILMILNSLAWIVYELTLMNVSMIVTLIIQLIAAIVGMITIDILGKKKQENNN